MNYSDVAAFVETGLVGLGYDPTTTDFPVLNPGPWANLDLQKLSTQRMIFLQLGGGVGLTSESLFDRPFLTVRVLGQQNDYGDAENLAKQLDKMLLSVVGAQVKMGTSRVLYATRTGAGPELLLKDASDRYHFQCTYVIETGTGL